MYKRLPLKAASNALLGLASIQIGKVGTAKPYFEKAISIEPEWAGGYFLMSAVFIRQNKPDIAIDYLYKVNKPNKRIYFSKVHQNVAYILEGTFSLTSRRCAAIEAFFKNSIKYAFRYYSL